MEINLVQERLDYDISDDLSIWKAGHEKLNTINFCSGGKILIFAHMFCDNGTKQVDHEVGKCKSLHHSVSVSGVGMGRYVRSPK